MLRASPCLVALVVTLAAGSPTGCTSKDRDAAPVEETPTPTNAVPLLPLEPIPPDLPARALEPAKGFVAPPPVSLTASDGTGLRLVSLTARAVVQEPLAFTELHLVFDNPEERTIEGNFTIDLPPDAAISRFAMKIGANWQEGEVVERQAARVAYEDFLHRKQDPALLENQAGNRFSACVFPILGKQRKELVVSYSQELSSSSEPYRLLLRGLPELESLDARVVVQRDTPEIAELTKKNFEPDHDLEVRSARPVAAVGLRHENLVVARVPAVGDMPPDPISNLTILFDTSASRALGFGEQLHRLGDVVAQLREQQGADFRLRVLAFDQEVAMVYDGPVAGFGRPELEAIYARRPLGASDLTGALRRIAESHDVPHRLLVMSDGIATAGDTEARALQAAVLALGSAGLERLDAIVDGGLQDRDALEALTTAGLARAGIVVDARIGADAIVGKLARATLSGIRVSVPGAEWSWPETVDGVQPGDEVVVFANVPVGAPVRVVLEGGERSETTIETVAAERPLLERAWVGARIDALTLRFGQLGDDGDEKSRLKQDIVAYSTKHRVLSDFTALLVLETEADYARFKIDRNALADILTVDDRGIAVLRRSAPAVLPPVTDVPEGEPEPERERGNAPPGDAPTDPSAPTPVAPAEAAPTEAAKSMAFEDSDERAARDEAKSEEEVPGLVDTGRGGGGQGEGTIGLGNVGVIGKGSGTGSGSGFGGGSGGGKRRIDPPRVRMAQAEVTGSLDKAIVRRVVRRHINEVRYCYEKGLVRDPTLAGRVTVRFTIGTKGSVTLSNDAGSTMPDRAVTECIVRAVRRWAFPEPPGGAVQIVTYPFILGEPPAGQPIVVPRGLSAEEEAALMAEARRFEEEQARLAAEQERLAAEQERLAAEQARVDAERERTKDSPYEGRMFDVMSTIERGAVDDAVALALTWRDEEPADMLALLALGEALEAAGKPRTAARAYGSLVDLFPSRADVRRQAGNRLERLGAIARKLAVDTYARAVEQRPDHPSSHRMLAYALLRDDRHEQAFEAIVAGARRDYPEGRFAGVREILLEDVGLVGAAWLAADPSRAPEIHRRVQEAGAMVPSSATTRFVMTWETDANDVDFHIYDAKGGHAYYSDKQLPSGGRLYADVTTGYGPECFTIEGKPAAFPYRFEANYYSRGPMGYGMGLLQIVQHDGKGTLVFDERPYVVMKDHAFVKLGSLEGPLDGGR